MCQHPQGGCTHHSLGAGVQNKQTIGICKYLHYKKPKTLRTILQSILLNLHPCQVGMDDWAASAPSWGKTAAAHQQGHLWPCQELITSQSTPKLNVGRCQTAKQQPVS